MESLELRNGDLVAGQRGFRTVSGAQKVLQDTLYALLEEYQRDRFHPRWGSILNQFVGRPSATSVDRIRSEIRRVVANLQKMQQLHITEDDARGRPFRYSAADIIVGVQDIKMKVRLDAIYAEVTVVTLQGDALPISITAR